MSENREMSVRSEMGHLELATSKMVALLEKLHAYVGDVLSEKVEGDLQVGWTLMELQKYALCTSEYKTKIVGYFEKIKEEMWNLEA